MPGARSLGLGLVVLGLGIGALLPVYLAIFPAAGIGPADAGRPSVVLPILAANPALVQLPAIMEIIVHAIGAVAIFGLWARFGATSFLLAAATLGGLVWMTIDIVDNAITLNVVPGLATAYASGDLGAGPAFVQTTAVTDAVRMAAHFVGGLWMVGISWFAVRTGLVPRPIGWLGVVVGAIFAGNVFMPALLNVSFMTVPLWLVIAGIAVSRAREVDGAPARSTLASA